MTEEDVWRRLSYDEQFRRCVETLGIRGGDTVHTLIDTKEWQVFDINSRNASLYDNNGKMYLVDTKYLTKVVV